MNRLKNNLLVVIGLTILALGFTILSLGSTAADGGGDRGTDVRVINTTAEPVPTVAQGTTNIAGAVTLNGTPNVNLLPGATVGIAPSANTVKIDNSNPVLMRDVDQPARQAFTAAVGLEAGNLASIVIPNGKRLVIEQVSAQCAVAPGEKLLLILGTNLQGIPSHHYIPVHSQGTFGSIDVLYASEQVRMYCDQVVNFEANGAGGSIRWTISGYLIDLP